MFRMIKAKVFMAKVQAELKAQIQDQKLVNRICHREKAIERILDIYETRQFSETKTLAPFLTAILLLADALEANDVTNDDKRYLRAFLINRVAKASTLLLDAYPEVFKVAEQSLTTTDTPN